MIRCPQSPYQPAFTQVPIESAFSSTLPKRYLAIFVSIHSLTITIYRCAAIPGQQEEQPSEGSPDQTPETRQTTTITIKNGANKKCKFSSFGYFMQTRNLYSIEPESHPFIHPLRQSIHIRLNPPARPLQTPARSSSIHPSILPSFLIHPQTASFCFVS